MAGTCPRDVRLMGLDLGKKTIGVAVSNSDLTIATAVKTIFRKKFSKDMEELAKIVNDYEIGGYIIGWPLNMDGTMSARCDAAMSFADEMRKRPEIFGESPWIAFHDERLSTSAVDDFLVETVDMSRTKRKHVIDKMAAQVILQGATDYIRSRGAGAFG